MKQQTDKQVNAITQEKWHIKWQNIAANACSFYGNNNKYIGMFSFSVGHHSDRKEWIKTGKENAALIASAPALKAENEKLREALLLARKRFYLLDKKDKTFTAGMAIDSINEILNQTK